MKSKIPTLPEIDAVPAKPTVLIVDDARPTREVFKALVQAAGYEVLTAEDGLDALEQIRHRVPDLILLDLDMPGMSGSALHRQLTVNPRTRHVPVLVVTGTDMRSPLPAAGHLLKPVTGRHLVASIRAALRLQRDPGDDT